MELLLIFDENNELRLWNTLEKIPQHKYGLGSISSKNREAYTLNQLYISDNTEVISLINNN